MKQNLKYLHCIHPVVTVVFGQGFILVMYCPLGVHHQSEHYNIQNVMELQLQVYQLIRVKIAALTHSIIWLNIEVQCGLLPLICFTPS